MPTNPSAPSPSRESPIGRPIDTDNLSQRHLEILNEELQTNQRVQERVAVRSQTSQKTEEHQEDDSYAAQLVSLRDQIAEARAEDVPALYTEMERIAAIAGQTAEVTTSTIDAEKPYFGHLKLEEEVVVPHQRRNKKALAKKPTLQKRDVLIGKRTFIDRKSGVVIVDWRDAPISRIYYRYEEDDDYEEEFGEQIKEGRVLARRTLTHQKGELVRIRSGDGTLYRTGQTNTQLSWRHAPLAEERQLAGGMGTASRQLKKPQFHSSSTDSQGLGLNTPDILRPDKHLPEIAALIDATQFDAMTQEDAGLVVLQGGAGSGKTTVALHRLAYLSFHDPHKYPTRHMRVIVPHPALVRYVSTILPDLDCEDVKVLSHVQWSRQALRFILPSVRTEFLEECPSEVSALKKHPAMWKLIHEQNTEHHRALVKEIQKSFFNHEQCHGLLEIFNANLGEECLFGAWKDRLARGKRVLPKAQDKDRLSQILRRARKKASDLIGDWQDLITDRGRIERILFKEPSESLFKESDLDSSMQWTSKQLETDKSSSDLDDSEHDSTTDDDEREQITVDTVDPFLILNLAIARFGGINHPNGKPHHTYSHLVVDEAQDLSAIELRPLIHVTGETQSVTLAGDLVQKVAMDNGYTTWNGLLEQLGQEGIQLRPFKLTYRSTAEINEFAHHVLAHLAPEQPGQSVREGTPVEIFSFAERGEEVLFLAEQLRNLMNREPMANVAVLCRYEAMASQYYDWLKVAEVPRLRWVTGGDFSFKPGIDVSDIRQVKGLEYDYVILVDATEEMYPDRDNARHLMHIGATRATHQLWVTTSSDKPSPILPREEIQSH